MVSCCCDLSHANQCQATGSREQKAYPVSAGDSFYDLFEGLQFRCFKKKKKREGEKRRKVHNLDGTWILNDSENCHFESPLLDVWFHGCLIGTATSFVKMLWRKKEKPQLMQLSRWCFHADSRKAALLEKRHIFDRQRRKMAGVSILHWILQNEAFTPRVVERTADHTWRESWDSVSCFEVQIRERLSYQSSDTDCTRRCRPCDEIWQMLSR